MSQFCATIQPAADGMFNSLVALCILYNESERVNNTM